ncbi:peptidylprolyl isomerase [Anaeromicropila populeti]|uniref:peptidylprolyl isomerase n=1 Tax=Anaeromicropila populeti TaxID=37658 RepID=A0A1I6JC98_9FIRM|nr:peptidylprolyl isomerase [Anaeromicropila populeti]SFR76561.1 PPIC-type PPIASE domain-containing protein [Anaeromicropila populeti]
MVKPDRKEHVNIIKKYLCYILVMTLGLVVFASCKKTAKNQDILVFTVGEEKIYLDEVMYQVWEAEKEIDFYQSYYEGNYEEDFWNSEGEAGMTMSETVKQEVYDEIIRESVLFQEAVKQEETITEEVEEEITAQAKEEMESMSEEERKTTGLTEKRLIEFKIKKAIIDQYFDSVLDGFSVDEASITEGMNESDYLQYDIETIGFSKYQYHEDGTKEEKSAEILEMSLNELEEKKQAAQYSENFSELLEDQEALLEVEEYSFVKGDEACDANIQEAAVSLKTGQVSDIIETSEGIYLLRVLSNSSTESYEKAKASAVNQQKYKLFDEYYSQLKEKTKVTEETSVWEDITVGDAVVKDSSK